MIARCSLLAASLLALLGAGLAVRPAWADDYETVRLDHQGRAPRSQHIRARVLATPAGQRHGGYGYVTIQLENPSEKPATVRMVIHPGWWGGSAMESMQRFDKTQVLEPGRAVTLQLPLLNYQYGSELALSVTGTGDSERVSLTQRSSGGGRSSGLTSVLTVWPEHMARHAQWAAYLNGRAASLSRGGSALTVVHRLGRQLPDRWLLLSGFDLVIVDRAQARLSPEQERVLERYVAGGGNLALLGMRDAAEGPLRELMGETPLPEDGGPAKGLHGLGRWIALAGDGDGTQKLLDGWLGSSGRVGEYGVMASASRRFSGSMPTPFWLPLEIPGLGEVPVKAFFFLLLLFAVVVGPINYIYFRRRKRLAWLLVTIPLTGFLCTLLILFYGWFSEGFGIIGSARTFTVLDQRNHTAACCTSRTLFASLQPARLELDPEAFFCSSSFTLEGYGGEDGALFRASLDGGFRVAGSALPSRTSTPFTTVSVGRARERLRFRRRPDGGFDVLAAPGFVPREEASGVLLRTADGAYYLMNDQGVLVPRKEDAATAFELASEVVHPLASMPIGGGVLLDDESDYWGSSSSRHLTPGTMATYAVGAEGLDKWLGVRLQQLPKGSYLARMKQPPLYDDFGLDVEYRATQHVVLGLLGGEDVIDE